MNKWYKVIQQAQKHLRLDYGTITNRESSSYICICIQIAGERMRVPNEELYQIQKWIGECLEGHPTVRGWLIHHKFINEYTFNYPQVQAYRLAWMKHLTKQLKGWDK